MSKSDSLHQSTSDTDLPTDLTENVDHSDDPTFGWNPYAELVNGRVAMLAVLGLLLLEWCTKQDLFTWLGLR